VNAVGKPDVKEGGVGDERSSGSVNDRRYRVGVDIGGTFTDFVLLDMSSGRLEGFKLLTTADDPSVAVFQGLEIVRDRFNVASAQVGVIVHATTLATNILIERQGARIGVITTEGFRDVLEMRRETRYDDLDLAPEFPPPLAPRHLRLGVKERLLADGSVRLPVDAADVRRVVTGLKSEGVEALAVCLLHASANPVHEEVVARIARESFDPELVSISSQVQPEIREYERMSTTAANAYVQPRVRQYLGQLMQGMAARGYDTPLYIMQSNGGFSGPEESSRFPVRLIESGPAAGAIAAADFGKASGHGDLISFDMGGTTAKIAVLKDRKPRLAAQLEVARVHRFKSGSGYPIRCPSIELTEIGAGGGSIASVDALGLVRVGPRSAGAHPGPACYGWGGDEPTVTDADLVLGYIDPEYFAGGRIKLDRAAAEAAIRKKISEPLGMDLTRAAWGIHDIVNQNMATAARLHVLARGEDPRRYTLVAFGGAGPIHAHRVAAALGIARVLHPYNAGVASARGLLVAPMAMDLVRTYHARIDSIDTVRLNQLFAEMEARALQAMGTVAGKQVAFTRIGDFRYRGQGYEIQTTLPRGPYREASRAVIREAFHATYEGIFGRRIEDVPVELVNLRLFARGPQLDTAIVAEAGERAGGSARKGERWVHFTEAGEYVACALYDRKRLAPGDAVEGPAILEEDDTSVVIPPGSRGVVDGAAHVIVFIRKS
jgi:N-methylhydantoinase A